MNLNEAALRGMVRAMQSVVFILLFMVVVTYVFAIVRGCSTLLNCQLTGFSAEILGDQSNF